MALNTAALNAALDGFRGLVTHISLHTAQPNGSGSNEVTGGSYARQAENYSAASSGSTDLASAITFAGMPAATVTHIGFWTASSGGTFLGWLALAASRTLLAGDSFVLDNATLTGSAS